MNLLQVRQARRTNHKRERMTKEDYTKENWRRRKYRGRKKQNLHLMTLPLSERKCYIGQKRQNHHPKNLKLLWAAAVVTDTETQICARPCLILWNLFPFAVWLFNVFLNMVSFLDFFSIWFQCFIAFSIWWVMWIIFPCSIWPVVWSAVLCANMFLSECFPCSGLKQDRYWCLYQKDITATWRWYLQ